MKKFLLAVAASIIFLPVLNAQIIFNEDFESGSLPPGWSQQTLASDGGWKFGLNTALNSNYVTIPAHTNIACTNDDACNCNKSNDKLITPSMNWSAYTSLALSFDLFFVSSQDTGTVDVSVDGGITWTTILHVSPDAAWQNMLADLSMFTGNTNVKLAFHYSDGGQWGYAFAIDNVKIYVLPANDASFTAIIPSLDPLTSYTAIASNVNIGGTIKNLGINIITSFTAKYDDGTGIYATTFSSLNIPTFSTYNFSIAAPYNVSALGAHPIKAWIELNGDTDHTNDTLLTTVNGAAFIPFHKHLFEEIDACWCGWSPRGYVFTDSIHNAYPANTDIIIAHTGDVMDLTPYDNLIVNNINSSFPAFTLNRTVVDYSNNIFPRYIQHANDFGFADLNMTTSFDQVTRQITVIINSTFAIDMTGDYRLATIFTEDSVYGITSNYAQQNWYSYQSNNIPFTGSGRNWQTEPNPIPASNIHYDHVARANVGGFTGQVGSLPPNIQANQTYSFTFNYIVPPNYRADKITVHAQLINATTNKILNVNSSSVNFTSGIMQINNSNDIDLVLFPVPALSDINVNFDLKESDEICIAVTTILGQSLFTRSLGKLPVGKNNASFDVSELAPGNYLFSIKTSKSVTSKMFIK